MRFSTRTIRTGPTALLCLAILSVPSHAQTTIDTRTGTDTWQWAFSQLAVGQAFTSPAEAWMESASLWVGASSAEATFRVFLQGWSETESSAFTGASVVGPVLWESALQTVSGSGPTRFDFSLGGVGLTPGQSYAFYASAVTGLLTAYNLRSSGDFPDSYQGGEAVYGFGSTVPDGQTYYDNGFVAVFSADAPATLTPEPSSLVLLLTGFVGLTGLAKRRQPRKSLGS